MNSHQWKWVTKLVLGLTGVRQSARKFNNYCTLVQLNSSFYSDNIPKAHTHQSHACTHVVDGSAATCGLLAALNVHHSIVLQLEENASCS